MAKTFCDVVHVEKGKEGEKPKFTNCGFIMTDHESGKSYLKLNFIPIGSTGWFSIFDKKKKEAETQTQQGSYDGADPF